MSIVFDIFRIHKVPIKIAKKIYHRRHILRNGNPRFEYFVIKKRKN